MPIASRPAEGKGRGEGRGGERMVAERGGLEWRVDEEDSTAN